jgi:hypothetical protein
VTLGYGSFKSPTFEGHIGAGSHLIGNFLSISGMRTDRFLDPPEFETLHGDGNNFSLFDRVDAHPSDSDTFRLNVQAARSSFNIPNTFDQNGAGQDQHQKISTFNIAPGYTRVIGSRTLFSANAFVRRDHLTYSPSPDPFSDSPGSVSQDRKLTNFGVKADVAYTSGANNVKLGGNISATKLDENFTIGFTDPSFNSPCLDAGGDPSGNTGLTTINQCGGALSANPDFNPDLLPYDLSRGGSPLAYAQSATIQVGVNF